MTLPYTLAVDLDSGTLQRLLAFHKASLSSTRYGDDVIRDEEIYSPLVDAHLRNVSQDIPHSRALANLRAWCSTSPSLEDLLPLTKFPSPIPVNTALAELATVPEPFFMATLILPITLPLDFFQRHPSLIASAHALVQSNITSNKINQYPAGLKGLLPSLVRALHPHKGPVTWSVPSSMNSTMAPYVLWAIDHEELALLISHPPHQINFVAHKCALLRSTLSCPILAPSLVRAIVHSIRDQAFSQTLLIRLVSHPSVAALPDVLDVLLSIPGTKTVHAAWHVSPERFQAALSRFVKTNPEPAALSTLLLDLPSQSRPHIPRPVLATALHTAIPTMRAKLFALLSTADPTLAPPSPASL